MYLEHGYVYWVKIKLILYKVPSYSDRLLMCREIIRAFRNNTLYMHSFLRCIFDTISFMCVSRGSLSVTKPPTNLFISCQRITGGYVTFNDTAPFAQAKVWEFIKFIKHTNKPMWQVQSILHKSNGLYNSRLHFRCYTSNRTPAIPLS